MQLYRVSTREGEVGLGDSGRGWRSSYVGGSLLQLAVVLREVSGQRRQRVQMYKRNALNQALHKDDRSQHGSRSLLLSLMDTVHEG